MYPIWPNFASQEGFNTLRKPRPHRRMGTAVDFLEGGGGRAQTLWTRFAKIPASPENLGEGGGEILHYFFSSSFPA